MPIAASPSASAAAVTAPAPLVRANGVTLQYKTPEHLVTATYRVSFDIFPGERYVILGPSGCGKSTILKAIAGFLKPAEGEILLKGKSIREPGPDRLMVFQEFDQLLPWKTVRQNVVFALEASGRLRGREALDRANLYIDKVNLTKFADSCAELGACAATSSETHRPPAPPWQTRLALVMGMPCNTLMPSRMA